MGRRYLYSVLLILLLVLALAKNRKLFNVEKVEPGSAAGNYQEDWYSLISREVNEKGLRLLVDGKEVDKGNGTIHMAESGELMIPVQSLTDAFSCAAHFYDKTKLVIEKYNVRAELVLGEKNMRRNGSDVPLRQGLYSMGDRLYVPVQALEECLSYEATWDVETGTLYMTSKIGEQRILPDAYDYRTAGRTPAVKNQGTLGTCWSFASLKALESRLLPEEDLDFSEDHMTRQNSFHMGQNDGGEYTMSMAYLLAWQGPVFEKDDAYGDGISPFGLDPVKHVQTIQILPGKDFESIKKAVYFYGGVQSSLYTSMVTGQRNSKYYNKEDGAYYYDGFASPNHDVVIIGWDDNYPKEKFSREPKGDGAFICANSWGGEFGDEGYFYVSYYDTNIGMNNILYTRVDDTDNYDRIYQTDLCGFVGQLGYGKESAYFANVYEAKENEELAAVGFYATGPDTAYEIYTVLDVESSAGFSKRKWAASGTFETAGYYTVDLPEPQKLLKGQRFAVIISIKTPGSVHPVAIEYDAPDKPTKVNLLDGEGYISFKGVSWERAEEKQNCNVCLKAYTRKGAYDGE